MTTTTPGAPPAGWRRHSLPRTPMGLKILLHTPGRLAVSVAGITLAVVLMLSQDGFRNALFDSQTAMLRHLDGELVILSRLKYLNYAPEPFASRRLHQARTVAGVRSVAPLYAENARSLWKGRDGSLHPVRVLAFDPDDSVFDFPEVREHLDELKTPDTVMFDERSRDYYGHPQRGVEAELAGRTVVVAGTFPLGTDFLVDGTVLMSDRTFLKFFPGRGQARTPAIPHPERPTLPEPHLDRVEFGVIRLEPGADVRAVQESLRQTLPEDVVVLTKQELVQLELRYWQNNSAIGYIFMLGMFVGFVIGTVICYQVLYSNVSNYLPQFATLKAMGFTDWFLVGVVAQQALFLAALGFVPAVAAAQGLSWVVGRLTGLVMVLTLPQASFILALTVAMCLLSAGIALRRAVAADPAEVFR